MSHFVHKWCSLHRLEDNILGDDSDLSKDLGNALANLVFGGIFLLVKGGYNGVRYANGRRVSDCAGGCGRKVEYNVKDVGGSGIPVYCQTCHDRNQRKHEVDIFYSQLIPRGWESSVQRPPDNERLGNKAVMLFKGKGSNGADYRVTWIGQGNNIHWTDQGLKEHDPRAHRDPRYED